MPEQYVRGGVITSTALQTNKPVLDDVDTTNAMDIAQLIQSGEELDRIRVCLLRSDDLDWNALLEVDGNVGWLVWCFERAVGHGPH